MIIREIYFREIGNLRKIEEKHVAEILELARNSSGGKIKKIGQLKFLTGKRNSERVLIWRNGK